MSIKTLVSGAAGFIGSHLTGELLNRGFDVIALDNFSTGRLENLNAYKDNDRLKIHEADISDGLELPVLSVVILSYGSCPGSSVGRAED